MMEATKVVVVIQKEIINHNLQIKALIQDINTCQGPLEFLNELNTEGRHKISALRKLIEQLESCGKQVDQESERLAIMKEVESYRQQLTSTLDAFRKANIRSMLAIEKSNKEELFDEASDERKLRHRQQRDKEGLVKMSSDVTEQLLSISRNLSDTVTRSAETLTTLANSSSNIHGTQDELLTTGSVISQSGKLLAKYGRREFTDKVLLLFAFAFFLACVLYIVQKRLF